jgi:hypothetical protein
MSVALALIELENVGSQSNNAKKEQLTNEFNESKARLTRINALVEDMEFDELDSSVGAGLNVILEVIKALNGNKGDAARSTATELLANATTVASTADKLITAGRRPRQRF